ncbi:MAG TPA: hypothetical protein VGR96_20005 [Acidobacteriaceae bacterium]|nr:hypothetical protein [Acidobacteriaceae bacterium]
MRRVLLWATVASGILAAYLMYRRGEPLGASVMQASAHPVGELANQIGATWKETHQTA